MTKQKYTDYRDRNPLYRCVDCNSSRNSTAGERHGTCYDCGGAMSTAGDRTRELDKEHAVDREWRRRGVCFDPASPYPPIIWTSVNGTVPESYAGLRAPVPRPSTDFEARALRLREYSGRATRHDARYACDLCGSSHKFTLTTVCAMCGGLMKLI